MKGFAVMVLRTCISYDNGWGWSQRSEAWMMDAKMFPSEKAAEEAMLASFRDERKERSDGCTLNNSTLRFRLLGDADRTHGVELWDGDNGDSGQVKLSWRIVCLEGEVSKDE